MNKSLSTLAAICFASCTSAPIDPLEGVNAVLPLDAAAPRADAAQSFPDVSPFPDALPPPADAEPVPVDDSGVIVIEPADAGEPTPTCSNEDGFCYGEDNPCCAGFFCDLDRSSYGQGRCRTPLPDGTACDGPEECASGACTAGQCGAGMCRGTGESCYPPELYCCIGFFCSLDPATYGQGSCIALLEGGALCEVDGQCASTRCIKGACAP